MNAYHDIISVFALKYIIISCIHIIPKTNQVFAYIIEGHSYISINNGIIFGT